MPDKDQGFTLLELLTKLTLLAVVLAVAIPSFNSALDSARQRTQINQLMSDLNFARSRAITSRHPVSICAGQENCNGSRSWNGQIVIFEDLNGNGKVDTEDVQLRISRVDAGYEWKWRNFRKQRHMTYKPDGTTHSLNGTLILCRHDLALKTIVINITGRARLGTPTADDHCL